MIHMDELSEIQKTYFSLLEAKLDELFPKGESKERGKALVLFAEAQMHIKSMLEECSADLHQAYLLGGEAVSKRMRYKLGLSGPERQFEWVKKKYQSTSKIKIRYDKK